MIETLLSNLIVLLGYIEETLRFILLLKLLYLSLPTINFPNGYLA
jgi:hypothetical protein